MATDMTVDDLIARVSHSPQDHLSHKSLSCLNAFILGYDLSLGANTGTRLPDPINRDVWEVWRDQNVMLTTEHAGRLNAFSCFSLSAYAELLASDECDAFDIYIEMREKMRECTSGQCEPSTYSSSRMSPSISDNLAWVVDKPAMFFGNGCSTHELFSFINGFITCDSDLGCEKNNRQLLTEFQRWANDRYPFASTRPWSHTFHFLALSHGLDAIKCFDEHFQLFLNGEQPDVQDPTEKQIIENIIRLIERDAI